MVPEFKEEYARERAPPDRAAAELADEKISSREGVSALSIRRRRRNPRSVSNAACARAISSAPLEKARLARKCLSANGLLL